MPPKEGNPSRDIPATKSPPVKTGAARVAAKVIRVSSLLSEDNVSIAASAADKNAVLETVVKGLCQRKGLGAPQPFLDKVLEREKGISTTLDTGLSLPHARMDGLADIVASVTVIPGGLADPGQPDLTIRVMFLFFSPNKPEFFQMHLQLLHRVSVLLKGALLDQVTKASTPAEVLELIRKAEK
ncbi:MAG: PTS sugar transporter subunit IIA [Elusimicrobia bacterium]|nr:PTS sugar transporter subunit IIA [Elusimicrobiota bacterium]